MTLTCREILDEARRHGLRGFALDLISTAYEQGAMAAIAKTPRRKADLRKQAIKIFEYTCQYCIEEGTEELGPDGRPWHLDRIIPGAKGGEYVANNVTLSCATCNLEKHDKILEAKDLPYDEPVSSLLDYEVSDVG